MAEWLGQLMSGWPAWAIVLAAVAIFVAGVVAYYVVDVAAFKPTKKEWKQNGKK